jgi:NADH-quinone oxidoreductase subunit H
MDAATSFWATPVGWTLATLGGILLVVVGILISLAFLLLADRKIWAGVQLRKGPNVVGPFGLLQSFADFFKFVLKEIVIPAGSDKVVFILAPLISFVLAFIAWAVIPFAPGWVVSDLNVGILYILAISSLGVYGIIMGGWASNSKYPFLGSLRSAAQMVSYEVSLGLIIINVILLAGTMNLSAIVGKSAEAKERRLVPEVIENFFTEAAPIAGFRLDAIKHIEGDFFNDWLDQLEAYAGRNLFCVGE